MSEDRSLRMSAEYKKTHKLLYTQLLQPPPGYRLERALATSYSLDLTMLMASALALYFQKEADDRRQTERYDVLAALEEAKDSLRIHFQRGHLKVPHSFNQLFHLLEPCLIEERPIVGSFHPKIWLLRFRHPRTQAIRYRLLSTSRNLTDSQDWDLSVFTEGDYHPDTPAPAHQAELSRFLQGLSQAEPDFYAPLLAELPFVSFEPPHDFDSLEFLAFPHPVDPFPQERFRYLLIMSPFLSERRLLDLSKRGARKGEAFLFSTKLALDGIRNEVLDKYQCYCINPLYVDALSQWEDERSEAVSESEAPSGLDEKPPMNLHAKFYAIRTEDEIVHLIGSANCTQAAFSHNTEALIRLHAPGNRQRLNIPTLARTFYEEHDKKHSSSQTFFIPYQREGEPVIQADPLELEAETLMEAVLRCSFQLKVKTEGNHHSLQLACLSEVPSLPAGWEVYLRPLTLKTAHPLAALPVSYGPLALKDLTAYVLLQIKYQDEAQAECLLKLDLMGAEQLHQARHQAVIQSLLNNIPKLLSYLSTVAENGYLPNPVIGGRDVQRHGASEFGLLGALDDTVPLYEKLLAMASQNPEQLRRVETVMQSVLAHPQIPNEAKTEFQAFWEPFHLLLQEQAL